MTKFHQMFIVCMRHVIVRKMNSCCDVDFVLLIGHLFLVLL